MNLSFLKQFEKENGGLPKLGELSLNEIHEQILAPFRLEHGQSYYDLSEHKPIAPTTVLLICSRNMKFSEFFSTCISKLKHSEDVFFWFDLFCGDSFTCSDFSIWNESFKKQLDQVKKVYFIVNEWEKHSQCTTCLYQIFSALKRKHIVQLVFPQKLYRNLFKSITTSNSQDAISCFLKSFRLHKSNSTTSLYSGSILLELRNTCGFLLGNKVLEEFLQLWLIQTLKLATPVKSSDVQESFQLQISTTLRDLYHLRKQYEEAETQCIQCISLSSSLHGSHHPASLSMMLELAVVFMEQNYLKKAHMVLTDCLEKSTNSLGPLHNQTIRTVVSLAQCVSKQGELNEAQTLLLESLTQQRACSEPNPLVLLLTTEALAEVYFEMNRYEEAEELLTECFKTRVQSLGAHHTDTLKTVLSLADLFNFQQLYEDAESMYRLYLEKGTKLFGRLSDQVIGVERKLAGLLVQEKHFSQAECLFRKLLDKMLYRLGATHSEYLLLLNEFGCVMLERGDFCGAAEAFTACLKTSEVNYGVAHANSVLFRWNVERVRKAKEKEEKENKTKEKSEGCISGSRFDDSGDESGEGGRRNSDLTKVDYENIKMNILSRKNINLEEKSLQKSVLNVSFYLSRLLVPKHQDKGNETNSMDSASRDTSSFFFRSRSSEISFEPMDTNMNIPTRLTGLPLSNGQHCQTESITCVIC